MLNYFYCSLTQFSLHSQRFGDYLEVIADSADHGPIYCVCTIKNNDGVNSLKKSGGDEDHPEVMDLSTAFEKIPGFELICNS